MTDSNKLSQYAAKWQDDRNGAALYRAISEVEPNPRLKSVYRCSAEAEERHACYWEAKLRFPLPHCLVGKYQAPLEEHFRQIP